MRSFFSKLMGGRGTVEAASADQEGALALLSSCPTSPGPDLDRWARDVAPHFLQLVKGPSSSSSSSSSSPSSSSSAREGAARLLELPRCAVAALLASDDLRLESEYQAYLFAAAHAEHHALALWRRRLEDEEGQAKPTTSQTPKQPSPRKEGGEGGPDLRGSDALYGQFSAGASKLLATQRTNSSTFSGSQQSETESRDTDTESRQDTHEESSSEDEQEEEEERNENEDKADSPGSAKQKTLNLRGTAGLYQQMSQGVAKLPKVETIAAEEAPKEEQPSDNDSALVDQWMAAKDSVTTSSSGQLLGTEEREASLKDKSESEKSKSSQSRSKSRQRGGKKRRRTKGKQATRITKKKGGKEEEEDDEPEDPDVLNFRYTDEWMGYMREEMAEFEPLIRFPLIAPSYLYQIEREKLISRELVTEAYRHQTLSRLKDSSLYDSKNAGARIKPRNYVTTVEWDPEHHGLHIAVTDNGRTAKKQQSHWYSIAVGKQGYETGQHYWAIKVGGEETYIGVCRHEISQLDNYLGVDSLSLSYCQYGSISGTGATQVAYNFPPYKSGDIIGVILDMDKKELSFTKNGTPLGVAFQNLTNCKWYPAVGWRAGHQTIVNKNSPLL